MKIDCCVITDDRVTKVGAFLKKKNRGFKDELPEIINVIKGEMSLVGPGRYSDLHLELLMISN